MAKIETTTATAPAYWACYLINGDATGFDFYSTPDDDVGDRDQTAADAWVESLAAEGWRIVGCDEVSFFDHTSDAHGPCRAAGHEMLAGAMLTYELLRTVPDTAQEIVSAAQESSGMDDDAAMELAVEVTRRERLLDALDWCEARDDLSVDDVEWEDAPPPDGATIVVQPGYWADDGNADIHYPDAEGARDAASQYVDSGDWGDAESGTFWITVYTWERVAAVGEDGEIVYGTTSRDSHTIQHDPDEPDCADGHDHDWQSPLKLVGGIRENPGVWGKGGGVIIREVCAHCGAYRVTDTWAQNPENGVQGLTSIAYEPADDDSLEWIARRSEVCYARSES